MSQILNVYLDLQRNASADTAHPLQIGLSTRARLSHRLQSLQEAADNGKGLFDLAQGLSNHVDEFESPNGSNPNSLAAGEAGARSLVAEDSTTLGEDGDRQESRVSVSKDVGATPPLESRVDVADFALEFESSLKGSGYGIANAPGSEGREGDYPSDSFSYQAGLSKRTTEATNGHNDDLLGSGGESLNDSNALETTEGFPHTAGDARTTQGPKDLGPEANPLGTPRAGEDVDSTAEGPFDGDFDTFEEELASLQADKLTEEGNDPLFNTNNSSTHVPREPDLGGDGTEMQPSTHQTLDETAEEPYHSAFEDDLVFDVEEEAKGIQADQPVPNPTEEPRTSETSPNLPEPENVEDDLLETSSLLDESAYVDDNEDNAALDDAAGGTVGADGTTELSNAQKEGTRKRSRSPLDDQGHASDAHTRTSALTPTTL